MKPEDHKYYHVAEIIMYAGYKLNLLENRSKNNLSRYLVVVYWGRNKVFEVMGNIQALAVLEAKQKIDENEFYRGHSGNSNKSLLD